MKQPRNEGGNTPVQSVLKHIAAAQNRGFLLDVFVFLLNLGAMALLTRWFVETVRRAGNNDQSASLVLFAIALALFVLAPVGATLKRWHHHRAKDDPEVDPTGSCLFNPIFYFCLTAVIFAAVNAFVIQQAYGRKEPDGSVFILSIFLGIALMVLHTVLVYRYFSPPRTAPKSAFLRSRASAFVGDACLFANMVLFQLLWNLLSLLDVPRPTGVVDVFLRFLFLAFLSLLLYFPPRMFYLADDIGKRRTWFMILLANSPILVRVLLGTETGLRW